MTKAPDRISSLRTQADQARSDAFQAVYGYTPDDWQNLSPEAQRRLRNERVQGLVTKLGNLNSAITAAQAEEQAAKTDAQQAHDNALSTLNTYLQYGVIDSVPSDQLSQLASAAGMSTDALQKISKKASAGELKEFNGNLYQVSTGADGNVALKLVMAGAKSGGSATSAFDKEASGYRSDVLSNSLTFDKAQQVLQARYPDKSVEEIQQALGGTNRINQGGPNGEAGPYQEVTGSAVQDANGNQSDTVSLVQQDIEAGYPLSQIIGAYPEIEPKTIEQMYKDYSG